MNGSLLSYAYAYNLIHAFVFTFKLIGSYGTIQLKSILMHYLITAFILAWIIPFGLLTHWILLALSSYFCSVRFYSRNFHSFTTSIALSCSYF